MKIPVKPIIAEDKETALVRQGGAAESVDSDGEAEIGEVIDGFARLDPVQRRVFTEMIVARSHSGPLPSPETLQAYDVVVPGLAAQLARQLEEEAIHRRKQEDRIVTSRLGLGSRGQWMAFILALSFGGGALWLGLEGHAALAGSIFTVTIVGLIATFLGGRASPPKSVDED